MIGEPRCYARKCMWFEGVKISDTDESTEIRTERSVCKAFPQGIPDEIAFGNNLHLKPVEGDNGIQYEEES
jgi:hypothetical protein